jgi:hypothetical protein
LFRRWLCSYLPRLVRIAWPIPPRAFQHRSTQRPGESVTCATREAMMVPAGDVACSSFARASASDALHLLKRRISLDAAIPVCSDLADPHQPVAKGDWLRAECAWRYQEGLLRGACPLLPRALMGPCAATGDKAHVLLAVCQADAPKRETRADEAGVVGGMPAARNGGDGDVGLCIPSLCSFVIHVPCPLSFGYTHAGAPTDITVFEQRGCAAEHHRAPRKQSPRQATTPWDCTQQECHQMATIPQFAA